MNTAHTGAAIKKLVFAASLLLGVAQGQVFPKTDKPGSTCAGTATQASEICASDLNSLWTRATTAEAQLSAAESTIAALNAALPGIYARLSALEAGASTYPQSVNAPTFSPAAPYSATLAYNVAITTQTAGATICYTTNGSTPAASSPGTCSAGTTYSTPINISAQGDTVLKALATKATLTNSTVTSGTYTVSAPATIAEDGSGVTCYLGDAAGIDTYTCTLSKTTAGANEMIVVAGAFVGNVGAGTAVVTSSGAGSISWSKQGKCDANGFVCGALWYGLASAAGAYTITVNIPNGDYAHGYIQARAYSGARSTIGTISTPAGFGPGNITVTGTATATGSLFLVSAAHDFNIPVVASTAGAGTTLLYDYPTGYAGTKYMAATFARATATGTQGATSTVNINSTSDTGSYAVGIELVPATGGGGGGGGSATFVESLAEIANPERGFYSLYDLGPTGGFTQANANSVAASGQRMLISQVYLIGYSNKDLDAAVLNSISAKLGYLRNAGLKTALRFSYTSCDGQPDADSISRILSHITQLSPLLNTNADVISVMQLGFLGCWGEGGRGSDTERAQVLSALLAATPSTMMIQARVARMKILTLHPTWTWAIPIPTDVSAGTAFNGSTGSRVGHHDDCFADNVSNGGTYEWDGQWPACKDAIKTYLATETAFVPQGGESCARGIPADYDGYICSKVQAELAEQHWSWGGFSDFYANWQANGCYDTIKRSLGYRFVLTDATFDATATAGGSMSFGFKVLNRGYAATYNPRPVYLVLKNTSTGTAYQKLIPVGTADPRKWLNNGSTGYTISATVSLSGVPAGTYSLYLWLPDSSASIKDNPKYAIQFANTGTWDAATGYNLVKTNALVISP